MSAEELELSEGSNGSIGDGNTSSRQSRGTYAKHWCFTWNNYRESDLDPISLYFRASAVKYVYQEERGESGTPHLQGYVEFRTKKRMVTLKRALGQSPHWERCRSPKHSIDYCSDPSKRSVGGRIWIFGLPAPVTIISELRPWQQRVVSRLSADTWNDRSIEWWWEPTGNVGKTALCKYLVVRPEFNALYVSGKGNDVKFAVAAWLDANPDKRSRLIVLWDCPRTAEDYISYSAIEAVKNGIFFSGKYESRQCVLDNPFVLCFANYPPRLEAMSEDRWKVEDIRDYLHLPFATVSASLPEGNGGGSAPSAPAPGSVSASPRLSLSGLLSE